MHNKKKNIVILGGGFAGLRAALYLGKRLRGEQCNITLIDARATHIYTPDLYEISTAFNKKITSECLTQLKDTVAIPFSKILERVPAVHFIRDTAHLIFPDQSKIELEHHCVTHYDYLVLAVGSVVNYRDIPGLQQYSHPLKTVADALAINCHLDMCFQTLWREKTRRPVSIAIGGGGATGVEFAGELPGFLKKVCEKYEYPMNHVSITIVEGSNQLSGQGGKVTDIVQKRLTQLGISIRLETRIQSAEASKIHIVCKDGNEILPFDLLVWTGGVMPNPMIQKSFPGTDKNGALPVNEFLQNNDYPNVFAAGDNAYFDHTPDSKPAPLLAQVAFRQGKTIARNIIADIRGKPKKQYHLRLQGVITPLGGKYAILKKNQFIFRGRLVWILRRLVDLQYALSILPFFYALKKWVHDTNIFAGND